MPLFSSCRTAYIIAHFFFISYFFIIFLIIFGIIIVYGSDDMKKNNINNVDKKLIEKVLFINELNYKIERQNQHYWIYTLLADIRQIILYDPH